MIINREVGVEGRFTFYKAKADAQGNAIKGTRRRVGGNRNLILNSGLDNLCATSVQDCLTWCRVGTSNITPAATQTSLGTQVAASSTKVGNSSGTQNGLAPYYGWRRITYRFNAGSFSGQNISEVGVGPTETGNLLCRALILNSSGTPAAITLLSDEVLDVVYEFRSYAPTEDAVSPLTLDVAGTTHAVLVRPVDFDGPGGTAWSYGLGYSFNVNSNGSNWGVAVGGSNIPIPPTSDGYMSASYGNSVATRLPYTAGTYHADIRIAFDLSQANFAGGLGAMSVCCDWGAFRYTFDPKIAKDSTKKLELTIRYHLARRVVD